MNSRPFTSTSINGVPFETHRSYTQLHKVFTEGDWSILKPPVDSVMGIIKPSAISHVCKTFKNPNMHHIYHTLTHQIRCTECKEKVPESVETLWRLMNMDMIHEKTYITIFIQSEEEYASNLKRINQQSRENIDNSKWLNVQV